MNQDDILKNIQNKDYFIENREELDEFNNDPTQKSASTYNFLGFIYFQYLNSPVESEKNFELAIQNNYIKIYSAYLKLGDVKLVLNKFKEAEQNYVQAIKEKNDYALAYNQLGFFQLNCTNKIEESIKNFKLAIQYDQNNPVYYSNLGLAQKELNQFQEAEISYKQAIYLKQQQFNTQLQENSYNYFENPEKIAIQSAIQQQEETNNVQYFNLGQVQYELGKLQDAEQNILQALKIQKDDPFSYNLLGLIYQDLQQFELSEKNYNIAIQLKPDFANAYHYLGILQRNYLKKYQDSEYNFKQAIKYQQNFPVAYNNLGCLQMNFLKNYVEAEKNFNIAINQQNNFAIAYYNLGQLQTLHLNQLQKGELNFKMAIYYQKDLTAAYNNLGYNQMQQGKFDEAEQNLIISTKQLPDFPNSYKHLGYLYHHHQGKYLQAEQNYLTSIEMKPDFYQALYELGRLYHYKLKNPQKAEFYYNQALKYQQEDCQIYYHLGQFYQNVIKDPELAIEKYEMAIDIKEDFLEAIQNISIIYQQDLQNNQLAEEYLNKMLIINQKQSFSLNFSENINNQNNNQQQKQKTDITQNIDPKIYNIFGKYQGKTSLNQQQQNTINWLNFYIQSFGMPFLATIQKNQDKKNILQQQNLNGKSKIQEMLEQNYFIV